MKITGAFLAEKVEARDNGMYVEGGVFPSLKEDPHSGQMLVWLVVLVQSDRDDENREFNAEIAPLDLPEAEAAGTQQPLKLEVAEDAFNKAKSG